MTELEARITDLESRQAFQDDTIQALNITIVKQQQLIDLLERKVQLLIKGHNELLEQWREIEDSIPPPHY
ncbi:SlyX family protein [Entomomonas asaccharolytica]|uniref:Protein SlyX homolog n=1 Tax=Entomomonas asaccharolytica TaxID=2785331 RepID=A0A974NHJ8_9GAMM|nr:SlyX family protein [Entomomonas asaccharolytica]QQP86716.1 SlyX family protein [Entomomonas asaccharolytica]